MQQVAMSISSTTRIFRQLFSVTKNLQQNKRLIFTLSKIIGTRATSYQQQQYLVSKKDFATMICIKPEIFILFTKFLYEIKV